MAHGFKVGDRVEVFGLQSGLIFYNTGDVGIVVHLRDPRCGESPLVLFDHDTSARFSPWCKHPYYKSMFGERGYEHRLWAARPEHIRLIAGSKAEEIFV